MSAIKFIIPVLLLSSFVVDAKEQKSSGRVQGVEALLGQSLKSMAKKLGGGEVSKNKISGRSHICLRVNGGPNETIISLRDDPSAAGKVGWIEVSSRPSELVAIETCKVTPKLPSEIEQLGIKPGDLVSEAISILGEPFVNDGVISKWKVASAAQNAAPLLFTVKSSDKAIERISVRRPENSDAFNPKARGTGNVDFQ